MEPGRIKPVPVKHKSTASVLHSILTYFMKIKFLKVICTVEQD